MERIQVDFAMQRGHEMILRRDPPFVRPELDEVDMRMLQSAPPPGLLAVDWFELDGDITFRYAIGGRKLLTHRLISGPFGMNEYVSFLLGVVEALDNCGHHLLRESCCLLEEKFLFVGEDWRDAALVYLPLRDPPAKKPVREELLGLAVRLIGKVGRVNGEAMQALLRLLEDPSASWSGIRVGMLRLMAPGPTEGNAGAHRSADDARHLSAGLQPAAERYGDHADPPLAPHARQPRDHADVSAASHAWRFGDHAGSQAAAHSLRFGDHADLPAATQAGRPGDHAESLLSSHAWRPAFSSEHADNASEPADAADKVMREAGGKNGPFGLIGKLFGRGEAEAAPPPDTMMFDDRDWPGPAGRIRDTGRARWLSVCGAVLAVALIWRYIYLPSPGADRLLISLGATLLAACGLLLLLRRMAAGSQESIGDSDFAAQSGYGSPGSGPEGRLPESAGVQDESVRPAHAAEIRFPWLADFARDDQPASEVPLAETAGRDGLGMGGGLSFAGEKMSMPVTGTAADGEETRLLHDETVSLASSGDGKFWLVREYEGREHRYPVDSGAQIIGRSETSARIVDKAAGVSRAHVEIAFDGVDVRIKDLASRNGTLLEGEMMIPYKEYVLRDGGEFRLAGPDGPKYTLRRGL